MFFEYPNLLYLEFLLLPLIALYVYRELKGKSPSMTVSNFDGWQVKGQSSKRFLRHIPFILRTIALALIILAIARPRSSQSFEHRRYRHRAGHGRFYLYARP